MLANVDSARSRNDARERLILHWLQLPQHPVLPRQVQESILDMMGQAREIEDRKLSARTAQAESWRGEAVAAASLAQVSVERRIVEVYGLCALCLHLFRSFVLMLLET